MKISAEPRFEFLSETYLFGRRMRMSIAKDSTRALWQGFMPDSSRITNRKGSELYSVEVYDGTHYFDAFNPHMEFEKWAAVAVNDTGSKPDGMDVLTIPKGQYAVFQYRGRASEVHRAYQYIYGNWVPDSQFDLDDRPHFAVMGPEYKGEHPDSEEELWIPVKQKLSA